MHRFALDDGGERHRLIDGQALTVESVAQIAGQVQIKILDEHFN